MARQIYQIAIVGMSGKGKTMSFRNMNPDTTGFINVENKPLPFANKFKHYSTPKDWQETYQKLIEFAKDPEITTVVLDSFSAYVDSLLRTAREIKKGFDVWNLYNEEIGKLMYIVKRYPKDIFMTAHYEWVETEEGAVEKRISVKGKEQKGMIESNFTIVHYADMKVTADKKREYFVTLNSDSKTSAKTPPMFLKNEMEQEIPNDAQAFLDRVHEVLDNNK
jgi:hypothetical protein